MGSGFYTFDEAAARLEKSKRSVHDYVKKGFIKKRRENGTSVLDREDVDRLAIDLGAGLPAMNSRTFFQIQSRLQRMEDEMVAVKHALELRSVQPLRPSQDTSLGLISACTTYLHIQNKEEHWTQALVDKWADIFERMDEETFNSLSKASNDQQAWAPFFKFCSALMDFCWENDRQIPSIAWQARAGRLDSARQRLRAVIVTWVEMDKGSISKQFLEALGSSRETLISRVAKG